MHTDEAVNARILGDHLEGRQAHYDPEDRHGPLLARIARIPAALLGRTSHAELTAFDLRLVAAVCAALLLLVLPLLADGLGRRETAAAMPWLAAGAPFVYFGGTFIHEPLFILLSASMGAALWRWLVSGRLAWALMAGAFFGLLIATKETILVTGLALLLAFLGWLVSIPQKTLQRTLANFRTPHLALAALVGLAAAASLFTDFGRHPSGLIDAVRGWIQALYRAGGQGHEKPWDTYAGWLLGSNVRSLPWFGWTLAAGFAAGTVAAWRTRRTRPLGWLLVLYTVAVTAVYSCVPYKTPWLLLNFAAPAALVAGIGLAALCSLPTRSRSGLLLAAAGAALAFLLLAETRALCFRFPVDPTNPLAYAPTTTDLERLPPRLEALLAARDPDQTVIRVIGDDYWPLPWYLRTYPNVGYWENLADDPAAGDLIIATGDALGGMADRLGPEWRWEFFGLRAEVIILLFHREGR